MKSTFKFDKLKKLTNRSQIMIYLYMVRHQIDGCVTVGYSELAREINVTHVTTINAVKVLKAQGLIECKNGGRGGFRVRNIYRIL